MKISLPPFIKKYFGKKKPKFKIIELEHSVQFFPSNEKATRIMKRFYSEFPINGTAIYKGLFKENGYVPESINIMKSSLTPVKRRKRNKNNK